MAEINTNPTPQTNPPDPQVPANGTTTVVPDTAPATVSNPPNPQVPANNGAIRIDITTTPPPPNDDAAITGPITPAPITPVVQPPVPQVVEVQAAGAAPTASGAGITGPIEGISPYGEENELPAVQNTVPNPAPQPAQTTPVATTTGAGITGPVDGISPYGEENDPLDIPNSQSTGVDPYEVDGANIGLTEEEIQQQDNPTDATLQATTLQAARNQQILRDQQKQANRGDWRVKLRLAPGATYLYDDPNGPGILAPLSTASGTSGVVFPYTPSIQMSYNANYNNYDLTHSNYRGYFYQGSTVSEIQLQAKFTAQDTKEAEYLLAVIHFFRSATKMFYGANDAFAGTPPPLVFLEGFGEYQFNRHPCVISQFNYSLPDNVDYIRARSPNISSTNVLFKRQLEPSPSDPFSSAYTRLKNALLTKGAINNTPPPAATLGLNSPTYVPTSIDISLLLLPMQTRQQISQNFNLKSFANGQLLKGGFW